MFSIKVASLAAAFMLLSVAAAFACGETGCGIIFKEDCSPNEQCVCSISGCSCQPLDSCSQVQGQDCYSACQQLWGAYFLNAQCTSDPVHYAGQKDCQYANGIYYQTMWENYNTYSSQVTSCTATCMCQHRTECGTGYCSSGQCTQKVSTTTMPSCDEKCRSYYGSYYISSLCNSVNPGSQECYGSSAVAYWDSMSGGCSYGDCWCRHRSDCEYGCSSGSCYTPSSGGDPCLQSVPLVSIIPDHVSPGGIFSISVSGVSSCSGKMSWLYSFHDQKFTKAFCSIIAAGCNISSQQAPSVAGTYKYSMVIDKNGNGKVDDGESGDAYLTVSSSSQAVTGSCSGKCGQYQKSWTCQCDSQCYKYNDCCSDYSSACNSTTSKITTTTVSSAASSCPSSVCGGKCGNYMAYSNYAFHTIGPIPSGPYAGQSYKICGCGYAYADKCDCGCNESTGTCLPCE